MANETRAVYELARRLARERGGRLLIVSDPDDLEFVMKHARKGDVVLLDEAPKTLATLAANKYLWVQFCDSGIIEWWRKYCGADSLEREKMIRELPLIKSVLEKIRRRKLLDFVETMLAPYVQRYIDDALIFGYSRGLFWSEPPRDEDDRTYEEYPEGGEEDG